MENKAGRTKAGRYRIQVAEVRSTPQCVGEMVFCEFKPQHVDEDSSFIYNI